MTGSSVSTPDAGKNAASHHALSLAQARPKQCLHSSSYNYSYNYRHTCPLESLNS